MREFSGKVDDERGARRQEQRGAGTGAHREARQHAGKRKAPRDAGERGQRKEQRRLGERGEPGLAARAHALERGPGVQGGKDRQETGKPEHAGKEHDVTGKGDQGRRPGPGKDCTSDHRGRDTEHGPGAEDPARRAAVDGALGQELGDVVVGLEERLAVAARRRRPSCG